MKLSKLLSIIALLIYPGGLAIAQNSQSLPALKGEYFISCNAKSNEAVKDWSGCGIDNVDYGLLENLGFEADEGEYEMTREDVDIATNTEWECVTVIFNFKSDAAADAFMKTFDELWGNTDGLKLPNRKSAGLRKNDLCVDRSENMVWLGYLYMFE
ncbi:MAG: hypothetical protein K2M31_02605 [Muribaculaceae bacterium]|nr:hypothetical protein [Muribaculaceae bacterium]